MQLNVPIRFTWITRVKAARSAGPRLLKVFSATPIPAQLTRTCTPPKRATTASSARATSSALVTSAAAKSPRSPNPPATSGPREVGRSSSATRAPSAARRSAVARPRPDAPPVITAVALAIRMPAEYSNAAVHWPGEPGPERAPRLGPHPRRAGCPRRRARRRAGGGRRHRGGQLAPLPREALSGPGGAGGGSGVAGGSLGLARPRRAEAGVRGCRRDEGLPRRGQRPRLSEARGP